MQVPAPGMERGFLLLRRVSGVDLFWSGKAGKP